MSDKELLELAAKAAGIEWNKAYKAYLNENGAHWLPLTNDGDALRLAVKLKLDINFLFEDTVSVFLKHGITENEVSDIYKDDPYAATRRAIVRAAAEIGRTL